MNEKESPSKLTPRTPSKHGPLYSRRPHISYMYTEVPGKNKNYQIMTQMMLSCKPMFGRKVI